MGHLVTFPAIVALFCLSGSHIYRVHPNSYSVAGSQQELGQEKGAEGQTSGSLLLIIS